MKWAVRFFRYQGWYQFWELRSEEEHSICNLVDKVKLLRRQAHLAVTMEAQAALKQFLQ